MLLRVCRALLLVRSCILLGIKIAEQGNLGLGFLDEGETAKSPEGVDGVEVSSLFKSSSSQCSMPGRANPLDVSFKK